MHFFILHGRKNMKRFLAFLLIAAVVVGTVVYLRKQGIVLDKEPAVCFVVEADNLYDVDFGDFLDVIEKIVNRNGIIMGVVADGEPYVSFEYDVPSRKPAIIDYFREKENAEYTEEIIRNLCTGVPKTPENDLLGAITLAERQFLRYHKATERKIIVISSGISRAGAFNFKDFSGTVEGVTVTNVLAYNPEKIVRKLEAANAIPDLTGVNSFEWYGLGRTAGGQEISENETKALRDLWTEITEYSGLPAKFTEIKPDEIKNVIKRYKNKHNFTAPHLNVSSSLQSTVITFGSQTPVETDITGTEIRLTEQRIGFVPGQAKLINQDKASRALEQYALDLKEWSPGNGKILIVGVIDSEEADEQHRAVALERAVMVKNLLISLDCPAAAFETATIKSESDSSDSSGGEAVTQMSAGQDDAVLILGSSSAERYELG